MDEFIRRDTAEFKILLHKMRTSEIDNDNVDFLLSSCLHSMGRVEHKSFLRETLHIMLT